MRIAGLIGGLILTLAGPALAAAPTAWTVTQKSGDVRVVHPGMQPASVQLSAALAPGDVVATGPTGRAMLTRGNDYVVVAPGSRLLLPPEEKQQSGFTRLVQQVGTMLYKVHHTGLPHFAVQTPMLAAVVKGTSFTVIVEQDRAAVQVTDGIVEVSSAMGQARRLVERGTTVYVGRERPDTILELKRGAPNLPASEGQAVKVAASEDVSLSAISQLTGGLVRPVNAPAVVTSEAPAAGVSPGALTATSQNALLSSAVQTIANAGTPPAAGSGQFVAQPTAGIVQSTLAGVAQPTVNVIQTTVPATVQPVINTVSATVPAITQPVINTVTTLAPAIIQPAVNTVAATVPTIIQPVINPVTTVTPAVVQPVINTATATVPAITQPVINSVAAVSPAITQPVSTTVAATAPAVTQPVVTVVQSVPTVVTQPVVNTLAPALPTVTQPVVSPLAALGGILGTQ